MQKHRIVLTCVFFVNYHISHKIQEKSGIITEPLEEHLLKLVFGNDFPDYCI